MVTAVNGKQLPALTVFAHVLEFFATHALQQLSDQSGTEFRRQDVRWVVTVPAIWREPAKQLMRQAALAVSGIDDDDDDDDGGGAYYARLLTRNRRATYKTGSACGKCR